MVHGLHLAKMTAASEGSVHPQSIFVINRGAKDKKIKRRRANQWLKEHGRTAKQVKRKKEKNANNRGFYS
tara:strand:- start:23 stop:232 length:210 start_codon:yes stop_codon:yes gene_type:complete